MILDITEELKLKCWNYLQNNNMGNRHSANGNKEQQFVGLVGEILTKNLFNIKHKFTQGFDGGYDFVYKKQKIDIKDNGKNCKCKRLFCT